MTVRSVLFYVIYFINLMRVGMLKSWITDDSMKCLVLCYFVNLMKKVGILKTWIMDDSIKCLVSCYLFY